jgi:hypothetical protein
MDGVSSHRTVLSAAAGTCYQVRRFAVDIVDEFVWTSSEATGMFIKDELAWGVDSRRLEV